MQPNSIFLKQINPHSLGLFGLTVSISMLTISRAILSIGMGIVVFAGIWELLLRISKKTFEVRQLWTWHLVLPFCLFLLVVLQAIFVQGDADWGNELILKLPLLLVPISILMLRKMSVNQVRLLISAYVVPIILVSVVTIVRLVPDSKLIVDIVGKNKSVMIASGISHIYFGVMLAFAVIISFGVFIARKGKDPNGFRRLMAISGILGFLTLHILTSRTGFVAFYGTLFFIMLRYILIHRKWLVSIGLLTLFLAGPYLAHEFSPSFRQRVAVSRWDFEQYMNDRICPCSITLRLIVWEATLQVFQANPVLGVGMTQLEGHIKEAYKASGYDIFYGVLYNPHNQYLEYLAGGGVIGGAFLLFWLFFPFYSLKRQQNWLYFSFIILIAISFLTESILERQRGIAFIIFFYCLLPKPEWNNYFSIEPDKSIKKD